MINVPTKDEIVERLIRQARTMGEDGEITLEEILAALTVPDLLTLLRAAGCDPRLHVRTPSEDCWVIRVPNGADDR